MNLKCESIWAARANLNRILGRNQIRAKNHCFKGTSRLSDDAEGEGGLELIALRPPARQWLSTSDLAA